jgi:hypothetical protein
VKYWKYRAYDKSMIVHDGVISHNGQNNEQSQHDIILQLRNNGLQIIILQPITSAEYQQENRLQKLRERLNHKPISKVNQKTSIFRNLKNKLFTLIGYRKTRHDS